ncbi:hypothetical protein DFQ26_006800 [Actinomortierella ambigua]|nr:hypothetical protein DFQ26_006800 [Actinomortierella ambigua]
MKVTFTKLPKSSYAQEALGPWSGYRLESDNILLAPIVPERDLKTMWDVYAKNDGLWQFFPCGDQSTFEDFCRTKRAEFDPVNNYFSWAIYLKVPEGDAEGVSGTNGNVFIAAAGPQTPKTKKVCVGGVSLLDITLSTRRFEIGAIWFDRAVHGTFVMLETNYLLLRFCFDAMQAGRVQWKCHHGNIASQKAALKLGFQFEGCLRKHILHHDGTWRNSMFYSMTDDDFYGREEPTTHARKGLDVAKAGADAIAQAGTHVSQGAERRLEELIADRKKNGKPIPESVFHR